MRPDVQADWVTVRQARDAIVGSVRPLAPEECPLLHALGYVLAEDVVSPVDLPPWDNSAMDGFAVRAEDIRGATAEHPRELRVVEDLPAGAFASRAVEPGTAIRIMTGAPVPAGADTVVRVEHTDGGVRIGGPDARVRVLADHDAGRNVRARGEDVQAGATVLAAGTPLRPASLGVAAAVGRPQLRVVRRPVVGILASGDELVEVDGFAEVLAGRRIVSSNSYSLAAQLAEIGAEARLLGIAGDSPSSLREHLHRAAGCDALITSAGISVGEHDHVREALAEVGLRQEFWRVRMRPGSPFAFGWLDGLGGIPWFGLPGNPVSTLVTFELFARPALLRMAGHSRIFAPTLPVRLQDAYPAKPGLTHFARARLERKDGEVRAFLTGSQSSGVLSSMAAADALLVIPEQSYGAAPGDSLTAILLGGAPLQESPGY